MCHRLPNKTKQMHKGIKTLNALSSWKPFFSRKGSHVHHCSSDLGSFIMTADGRKDTA